MSTAVVALLAAIVALLATVGVAMFVLRGRRASDMRLEESLLEVGARMDGLARELAGAVERVREDAARARIVESLGQALDLDEVLARCAEAAAALHGVAGASVSVAVDDLHVTTTAGLSPGPAAAGVVSGPPDGAAVRAVGVSYHYVASEATPASLRSAIAVPLEAGDGTRLGFLTVFGRTEDPPVSGNDFATLEAIARHCGPAIESARLRRGPVSAPESDPLTGLGTRLALHETLALETARALRHRRKLALCTFDLDGFKQINERLGQLGGDGILVEVADLLRETMRPGDLAYRSGGDEFAVIMPDAGRIDGEALSVRLQGRLGHATGSAATGITLTAGIAELKPDDDGVSLYERAERALYQAKETKGPPLRSSGGPF